MKPFNHISRLPHVLCGFLLLLLIGCSSGEDGHEGHDHAADQATEDSHEVEPTDPHAGHAHEGEPDEAHSDEEGHVELTEKQFRAAGIEVQAAVAGRVSEALMLPGVVAPNTDAVLHVTPRVPGQVRSASKHLGDAVQTGEVVCVIDSVELGRAAAEFIRDRDLVAAAEETLAQEQELYSKRIAALTTVLEGAISIQELIYKREEELQSKALSTMRPLLEANKALQLAKLELDRQLTEIKAERDARFLTLEVELRARRIEQTAARSQLLILGVSPQELEQLDESSPLVSGEFKVLSPGDGVVVNRHASIGEYVEAGAKLYILEDLSTVWFVASVFEEQLLLVQVGQSARVSLDAFPGTSLSAEVSFLDYHVDPTSRSVGLRITLDNEQLAEWPEDLPLRPGMFGRVELETASRQAAVVLPEKALLHEDAGDYVFVQVEPFAFERRDVKVKHVAGDMVEVTSGLKPGEMVAISGTFLLKSAERQAELGGGHSH